ncbi:sensor domain-containing diguanylate cyclase [Shewanella sp. D64]|uniref:sensor domain-containing diguanylate cyclase n=1 Tax=unclassified Shewanella TaxID=196818 RepID=UPI0022BA5CAC|nr:MULTISPECIES: sensor domain-containing diguanylate cyclase [unclassified Shewanella]MEC4726096.1 sensor domain-containing diguanylate cyclase [Shewanella sp. D64]MEC4737988.1 sensor domain-containing diguanylate cyclase [Shewanella sp. E94]WBJ96187.1 sensor domain-containing diguanylate cyclase [Shewanella sp. MTB7]
MMTKNAVFETNKFLLDNPNDLISLDKWQKTVNLLAKLFDAPAGFLVQHTSTGFQVTIASEQDTNPYPAGVVIQPEVNIFCRKIVETGKELYVSNAIIDPSWDTNPEVHNDGFSSYLGVPVFWPDGKAFGTFCVMDYKETHYKETYLELIRHLKDILEADLSMLGMYEQAQKLALTDALCGINNRRGFSILAEQRIRFAKRTNSQLGLLYLDIDKFKSINDLYGHNSGDKVLKHLALVLNTCVRQSDVIGRMGGDEFVALVLIDGEQDMERIKQRITAGFAKADNKEVTEKITVSIGEVIIDNVADILSLIDKADKDMLLHKQRNR